MPPDLDRPDSIDQLYLYRGSEVVEHRPLMQGDVFEAIEIPGLDDGPGLALILTHPCSMRRGAKWAKRILVARVVQSDPIPLDHWPDRHFRVMPLPGLKLEDKEEHYSARFEDCGSVAPDQLMEAKRIACLDPVGITLLQQRYVHYLTRYEAARVTLLEVSEPDLIEAELLEDWLESALEADVAIEAATKSFLDFIRAPRDGTTLQKDLEDRTRQAAVRREVGEERKRLYPGHVPQGGGL